MKNLNDLNKYRRTDPAVDKFFKGTGDATCGAFAFKWKGVRFFTIAASGAGWDHVSVSCDQERCPTWDEMCMVKRLFFLPNETVMQLHVPASTNVSYHRYCLHLWRPQGKKIPTPPAWMVGPQEGGDNDSPRDTAREADVSPVPYDR